MEMVFTKETMAASSARGQKAMGKNSMENASPRPPLDQNAVQAIVCKSFLEIYLCMVENSTNYLDQVCGKCTVLSGNYHPRQKIIKQ